MLTGLGIDPDLSLVYRNTGSYFQHVIPDQNKQRLNRVLVPIDFDNDGDFDLLQKYFESTTLNGQDVSLGKWALIENTTIQDDIN